MVVLEQESNTSTKVIPEDAIPGNANIRFARITQHYEGDKRVDNSNIRLMIDTSQIPKKRDPSKLRPEHMKNIFRALVQKLDGEEQLRASVIPGSETSSVGPIESEEMCVRTQMSKSIIPVYIEDYEAYDEEIDYPKPNILQNLDRRGIRVETLKSNMNGCDEYLEQNLSKENFGGSSRLLAGLLQMLYHEIDDRPSAISRDMIIILTNNYECKHQYSQDPLDKVIAAIREREHCEIHIITGDFDKESGGNGQAVNPQNSNDSSTFEGGIKYIQKQCPNVFIHTYKADDQAQNKIAEQFNFSRCNIPVKVIRPGHPVRLGIDDEKTGEQTCYGIRAENHTGQEFPPKTRMYLEENSYFEQSEYSVYDKPIADGEKVTLLIECKPKENRGIAKLPKTMKVHIEVPFGRTTKDGKETLTYKVLKTVEFEVNVDDYILGFYSPLPIKIDVDYVPIDNLTVLFMGFRGAGKSSTVASMATLLSASNKFLLPPCLLVSESENDVTKKPTDFKPSNDIVESFLQNEKLPHALTIKDYPGFDLNEDDVTIDKETNRFEHKRFTDKLLPYFLHGVFPSGSVELRKGADSQQFGDIRLPEEYVKNLQQHMIENHPHVVVFCLTTDHFSEGKEGDALRIQKMIDKIKQEGVPVLFNITKMDQQVNALNRNPFIKSTTYDEPEKAPSRTRVQELINDCATSLGENKSDIMYSVSYGRSEDTSRIFEYDQLLFSNLEKIQTVARSSWKNLHNELKVNKGEFKGRMKEILKMAEQEFEKDY